MSIVGNKIFRKLNEIKGVLSGTLEGTLASIANDMGILKVENGQLKGFDGTDWVPVQVTPEGRLVLASDVTVNAEGLVVDLASLVLQGKDPQGNAKDIQTNADGVLKVQQSGTDMEHFGVDVSERPPANSVPVGATFMVVGTTQVWQSNGTDWVVM